MLKLTIKTPERRQWRRSCDVVLVFSLLTFNIFTSFSSVFIGDFETSKC